MGGATLARLTSRLPAWPGTMRSTRVNHHRPSASDCNFRFKLELLTGAKDVCLITAHSVLIRARGRCANSRLELGSRLDPQRLSVLSWSPAWSGTRPASIV